MCTGGCNHLLSPSGQNSSDTAQDTIPAHPPALHLPTSSASSTEALLPSLHPMHSSQLRVPAEHTGTQGIAYINWIIFYLQ